MYCMRLFLGIVMGILIVISLNRYNVVTNKCDDMLGSTFIIQKDTVHIIDYSVFEKTFLLSDGRVYSWEGISYLFKHGYIKTLKNKNDN